MERFTAGNRAFQEGLFSERLDLFAALTEGQHPVALYIGCSDSRVPIELIAGAMPGDLYVVRNMGNIVPPSYYAEASVGAAVDHAVRELGVEHAIVCGHYGCGAIAAIAGESTGGPHFSLQLSSWLAYAHPVLERVQEPDRAQYLRRLAEENVRLQMANLRTCSPVKEAEEAGRLQLHGWIYDWDSGTLLEDRAGVFQPL